MLRFKSLILVALLPAIFACSSPVTALGQGHAPPCPKDFAFQVGGNFFYTSVNCKADCTNGTVTPFLLVYNQQINQLGCGNGQSGCWCNAAVRPIGTFRHAPRGKMPQPLQSDDELIPAGKERQNSKSGTRVEILKDADHIIRVTSPKGDRFLRCATVRYFRGAKRLFEISLAMDYAEHPGKKIVHQENGWHYQATQEIPQAHWLNKNVVRFQGRDFMVASAPSKATANALAAR